MFLILFCLCLLLISIPHHKFLVHLSPSSSAANIHSVYHFTSPTVYLLIQTHTLYHLNISCSLLSLEILAVSLTNLMYILLCPHCLSFYHYYCAHVILLTILFILASSLFYDILCSGLVMLIRIFFFFWPSFTIILSVRTHFIFGFVPIQVAFF